MANGGEGGPHRMFLFSLSFWPQKVALAQVSTAFREDTPAWVAYSFKAANPSDWVIWAEMGLFGVRISFLKRREEGVHHTLVVMCKSLVGHQHQRMQWSPLQQFQLRQHLPPPIQRGERIGRSVPQRSRSWRLRGWKMDFSMGRKFRLCRPSGQGSLLGHLWCQSDIVNT